MKAVWVALLLMLAKGLSVAEAQTARLSDFAWLEGRWSGPGIDGAPAVEVYSAPAGGQMIGHFRQLAPDGAVLFYELLAIVEDDSGLAYRIKHFNPDLTGWEDKNEVRIFPLTRTWPGGWQFGPLTLERTSADRVTIRVVVEENGKAETLVFNYARN